MVGPGVTTFDLTVSKSFCVREGHSVLFRTEFFNAFKTPQFSNSGGTLVTGAFGVVTGPSVDNRQIQLALKYSF